ncbi:MAG: LemA family protein [bacterium]
MKKGLLVVIALIAVFAIWAVSARNNLVTQEEGVKEKWSQVENVYQRRLDLIPNLVNTVKGYAAHEKETLEGVVEARAKATQISGDALKNVINDPQAFQKFQESQSGLSSALSKLMVVVEKYPDLKANQNFLQLQSQLEGTENRIAVERMRYNEAAKEFNVSVRRFPAALVASIFGFKEKAYFQADAAASKAPEVKF